MGELSVTALVSEVQAALLGRTDLTGARCVTALNFAQARISRAHDFRELKGFYNTTCLVTTNPANDKFLPLAPFVKHIHTIILQDNTSSRKLVEKPWRVFDRMWPMPEALARSRPVYYSQWNLQAILYPVPDNTYPTFARITTYPRPFNLAAAPDAVSDFNWKDDILVALAAAYLWKSYGRMDKANDYLQEAAVHFSDAVKEDTDIPDMDINIDLATSQLGQYWADPFIRTTP